MDITAGFSPSAGRVRTTTSFITTPNPSSGPVDPTSTSRLAAAAWATTVSFTRS